MKFTPDFNAWGQDANKLKLSIGDRISIYSEKAYRKEQGTYFEAVGNVVIKSGQDTIYGQKASFNFNTGLVNIEGNVRFIGQGVTLYGSQILYNSKDQTLDLKHARVITEDFSIIANSLKRLSEKRFIAQGAEFTTCKDCVESWTIYGEKIDLELSQYVKIYNAMIKAKGVSLLYVPFVALPVKDKRESGLLFPQFYTRVGEGLSYKQPIFWAIDPSKDMTFTPGALGKRGYGLDLEYRQVFAPQMWVDYNHFLINDNIYAPSETDLEVNSKAYFRNFVDTETHLQWSHDLNQHMRYTQTKDLDFLVDFSSLTDDRINASDIGFQGHLDYRQNYFSLGMETGYRTNLLVSDVEGKDKSYVQILPKLYFNTSPVSLFQADRNYLHYISAGMESDFTVFKQDNYLEDTYIRNANRFDLRPHLSWGWFSIGPLSASSTYSFEFQEYQFHNFDERFQKRSGVITTEFSFEIDRIFGIAYEKQIPLSKLSKESAQSLATDTAENPVFAEKNFIGELPPLQNFLKEDKVTVRRNSYRHSQEFKLIHYMLAHSEVQGNEQFEDQISTTQGWFDYQDAIQNDLSTVGSNATRTSIPRQNTLEFQWNNQLVKKSPKTYDYFKDNEYLRDHFYYSRIGFFNLSQGVVLADQETEEFSDRLTRLLLHTGYNLGNWDFDLKEFYFHQSKDHIFNMNVQHRLGLVNLLGTYNYNSFEEANLKTMRLGVQYRPIDTFGMSVLKEHDLDEDANIRTIVQFDVMPNNNCWIFNVNFKDSLVEKRYAFNIIFNFGNEDFDQYRTNFFSFDRLN